MGACFDLAVTVVSFAATLLPSARLLLASQCFTIGCTSADRHATGCCVHVPAAACLQPTNSILSCLSFYAKGRPVAHKQAE